MNIQRSACLTGLSLFPNPLGTIIQSQKNKHNGSSSLTQGFSLPYSHSSLSLCPVSSSFSSIRKKAARCPSPEFLFPWWDINEYWPLFWCVAVCFVWHVYTPLCIGKAWNPSHCWRVDLLLLDFIVPLVALECAVLFIMCYTKIISRKLQPSWGWTLHRTCFLCKKTKKQNPK